MKTKLRFLTLLIAFGITGISQSFAQDLHRNQVPSLVMNSFKKEFPKVKNAEWEMSKGLYEVEFKISRMDYEIWYNAEGDLVKMKREMRLRDLADSIKDSVKAYYKGYRIGDVEKLTQNGRSVYKIEMKNLREDFDVFVDESGKIIEGYIWD